ncbi:M23 family metallopeptidase [Paenibacillus lautus]|uniref:M23 family metallopeptidase n=1 Tax=Paenibacillus lautus TaxID=1401 RepID=A0A385TJX2_PAELA|nr:M23 family metallopeptidase [Paenibacillus lautus]AYB43781.1 M23 family metallopeptidase [Paenibacillus lautus]
MVDVSRFLLNGEHRKLYELFGEELRLLVTIEQFEAMAVEYTAGVKTFHITLDDTLNQIRLINWMDDSGQKGIQAMIDETGTIVGLMLSPIERFPESDAKQTVTVFRVPFKGRWYVFWGGENVTDNYHYAEESQRYAIDVIKTENAMSYEGDPAKNESYFAFGEEILAGARGKVVGIENNVRDIEPVGETNKTKPVGNYVIIDHGHSEYSLYAHLKQGSVCVKEGSEVEAGDLIGLCGNSGNSTEAHLHFQVSDHPDLFWVNTKSLNINWLGNNKVRRGQVVFGGV